MTSRPARSWSLAIFVAVFSLYLVTSSREPAWGDARGMWEVANRLVGERTIAIDVRWPEDIPPGRGGKYYGITPIGTSLVHLPGVVIARAVHGLDPRHDALARPLATLPIGCKALRAHPAAVRKRAFSLALDALDIEHDSRHLDALDLVAHAEGRGEVMVDLPGARVLRSYDLFVLAGRVKVPELGVPDGPYELRRWQPGDRMRPARLKGRSRKLSDLFIDAKVPRSLRTHARVLVRTTDAKIVWVEHLGIAFEETDHVVPKPVQMGGSF